MFYSKPMTNPLCILRRSGLPEQTKVSTAVSEILRRWKTCSLELRTDVLETITKSYMDNLCAMGYSQKWREEVLQSALTGYQRILHKMEQGVTRRNRKGIDTYAKRRFQKLCGIAEWYRATDNHDDLVPEEHHGMTSCRQGRMGRRNNTTADKYT